MDLQPKQVVSGSEPILPNPEIIIFNMNSALTFSGPSGRRLLSETLALTLKNLKECGISLFAISDNIDLITQRSLVHIVDFVLLNGATELQMTLELAKQASHPSKVWHFSDNTDATSKEGIVSFKIPKETGFSQNNICYVESILADRFGTEILGRTVPSVRPVTEAKPDPDSLCPGLKDLKRLHPPDVNLGRVRTKRSLWSVRQDDQPKGKRTLTDGGIFKRLLGVFKPRTARRRTSLRKLLNKTLIR